MTGRKVTGRLAEQIGWVLIALVILGALAELFIFHRNHGRLAFEVLLTFTTVGMALTAWGENEKRRSLQEQADSEPPGVILLSIMTLAVGMTVFLILRLLGVRF